MSRKIQQPGRSIRKPPASGRKPSHCMGVGEIAHLGDELVAYHREYHSVFRRREQRHCSMFYLCGQLSDLERKTIEPMVMALDGPDLNAIRALQQFIGQSPWSTAAGIQNHQRLVAESLADPAGILIVDGSGFPKQGSNSAQVAGTQLRTTWHRAAHERRDEIRQPKRQNAARDGGPGRACRTRDGALPMWARQHSPVRLRAA